MIFFSGAGTELSRAASEDGGCVGFGDGEGNEDVGDAGEDQLDPV